MSYDYNRKCKAKNCGMPLLHNEGDICDICKSGYRYRV